MLAPVRREIVLREYQQHAYEEMRKRRGEGARRILLASPTGSGKTEQSIHTVLQSRLRESVCWFIVDRKTLIDQTSERFASYGIDHGVMQADHWLTDPSKPVQIWTAQTLGRRLDKESKTFKGIDTPPDLIIWDECHTQYADVLTVIGMYPKATVIGLSATPFTAGMADHWNCVVNGTTVNALLKSGHLVPLKIKACVRPDMTGARKKFTGEYDDDDAAERGIVIVGDVVKTWIEQTARFFGGPVKTIVFSPTVKHGEELCRQFAEAGYNFQQISYLDNSDTDRRDKIREFRKPDSVIHGLVSCAVLTKGFDVPDVRCGISCRPYRKSFSNHIQELGRVMRPAPGKDFGLWLDHSGNCIAFADDTAWLYENGVDSLSNAQKKDSEVREPTEKITQKFFCAECGMQMEPGSNTCPNCGWERPKRSEIQVVQGELIDLDHSMSAAFKPRKGLHASCLSDPRAIWNAAVAYRLAHTSKGEETARRQAYGTWKGIYPDNNMPRGLFDAPCHPEAVKPDEWSLIDREVRNWRQRQRKKAA